MLPLNQLINRNYCSRAQRPKDTTGSDFVHELQQDNGNRPMILSLIEMQFQLAANQNMALGFRSGLKQPLLSDSGSIARYFISVERYHPLQLMHRPSSLCDEYFTTATGINHLFAQPDDSFHHSLNVSP